MAIRRKDDLSFGNHQSDIREELIRYSRFQDLVAEHFADARCSCGATHFELLIDEELGIAARLCPSCDGEHGMGDSDERLDETADPYHCECICECVLFEITIGVAVAPDSGAVRWLYVGCRCPQCGLTGCYGDWKNEFSGYRELLANV